MIALADCNNFFVSVERVFDPRLRDRPVAVLSSNDGCIVARSNEVKALGIGMGVPVFTVRNTLERHGVILRSSNFALYGDMSQRVMATLRACAPGVETYSIDEAFMEFPDVLDPHDIRQTVLRNTGIPVSIGIAPTRTLAKAAATLAKRRDGTLRLGEEDDHSLKELPVEEVWGIGRALVRTLHRQRVLTAYDLKMLPDEIALRHDINIQRIVTGLRGIPAVRPHASQSKSMVSSRSFGEVVSSKSVLAEAISSHAAHIGVKLRREHLSVGMIKVFIGIKGSGTLLMAPHTLPVATNDTREITRIAKQLLDHIHQKGLLYKRAGVAAYRLQSRQQPELGMDTQAIDDADQVNQTLDAVNQRWGAGSLRLAAEGVNGRWQSKHELRSPRYTTEWSELKEV